MMPLSHTKFFQFGKSFLLACTDVVTSYMSNATPVKIFILAGESNMHGKGTVSPVITPNR
jgi:hypothetical protein